jgi:predicted dehydrogenase
MLRTWSANSTPIFFMSSHDIDLVQWYVGSEPVEVCAYQTEGVLATTGFATVDGIQAMVKFASGAVALFHSSWIHPNTFPTLTDGYMEIIGSQGTIYLKGRQAEIYNQTGGRSITFSGPATATEVGGQLLGAFRQSLELFAHSIATDTEPMTSAVKTLPVAAMQFAIHDCLKDGRPRKVVDYLAPLAQAAK